MIMRELSELESAVLVSLDRVGWYAYLWFPYVQRDMLNFGVDVTDEEVHAAFMRLVQEGFIREVLPEIEPGKPDLAPPV